MDLLDKIKSNIEGADTAKWKGVLYPDLSWQIVGAAIEVHKHIGPGQLESAYERSLQCELRNRGLSVRSQVPVPMFFKGERVGDYFADLIVEEKVVLELKAVEVLKAVHTAQLVTYLSASGLRLGMLMNFCAPRMIQGIKRVVR
jgi:GxxExxY protein